MKIRPFDYSDADYTAITTIHNLVDPERPRSEQDSRNDDEEATEKYRLGRLLAFVDDQPVGEAWYGQFPWSYRPGKFWMGIKVIPDFRNQGIGTALYTALMETLAEFDPTYFVSGVWENEPHSIRFVEKREFVYAMRYPFSVFNPQTFDPTPFTDAIQRFEEKGYTIKTVTEFKKENEGWGPILHELINTISMDVPSPEPHVASPYEEWLPRFENYKTLIQDAYFIAFDGGKPMALSFLLKNTAKPESLHQGLTGTLRAYRRQGIARVLKIHGFNWAKAQGYTQIETDNEENNPMYALNMQLGFEARPAELEYIKDLQDT